MYVDFDVSDVDVAHVSEMVENFFQLFSISIVLLGHIDVTSPVVSVFGLDLFIGFFMIIDGVR